MHINKIESKYLSEKTIKILEDSKVNEITCINLKNKVTYADYMIIATCRSAKHANAVAEDLVKKFKKMNIICPQPEGRPKCDWTIVDSGSIVVHLFKSEVRSHYNLEKLWDMSFDSQNNKLI